MLKGGETVTNLKERRKQYRSIFELVNREPRIYIKTIASKLGIDSNTASKWMKEAYNEGHIYGPNLRRRSHANHKEYIYLLNCKDPRKLYLRLIEDARVTYHAVLIGFPNLWVISKEEIDFEHVMVKGLRSDFHVSIPPNHSWDTAFKKMRKRVEEFSSKEYAAKKIIKTHWDEVIEWDAQDEELFSIFKYNVRHKLSPIMKEHHIPAKKIYEFLERLPKSCSIMTYYFPEPISTLEPYFFIMETDYEDFIIELFSELPTSCFFFKVADRLVLYVFIKKEFLRFTGINANSFDKLQFNILMMDLLKKEILKSEIYTVVEYYWKKDV